MVQTQPNGALGLTINKVIAGAGAAATSAVLGSFFGAEGTVAGAALGSVASTVAATLYQQSLDRTRDRLVARVRMPRRGSQNVPGAGTGIAGPALAEEPAAEVTMPMPRISPEGATTQLRVEPAVPARISRRRFVLWSAATVLIFALSMLAVTGIEWAKGSTLTAGESGTSVGRVIEGRHERTSKHEETVEPSTRPEPSRSSEPTTTEPSGDATRSTGAPESGANPSTAQDSGGSPTSRAGVPTQGPGATDGSGNGGSGNDRSDSDGSRSGGSGSGGSGGSGSGSGGAGRAVPTPLAPVPGAQGQ
jgi:uncharacterized membrane protein YgcG